MQRSALSRALDIVSAGAGLALLALASTATFAQDAWPTRAIRLICGYPAASSPDLQARLLAEPLSKALGQPVVVENKPGAGGNIGTDLLAKTTDDLGPIGAGSGSHLGMELIKEALGLQVVHVPFPGGPQIVNALAGEVQMTLLPGSTVAPTGSATTLRSTGS